LVCRKSVPSALLHFSGKVAHGLLRDDAAFASGKGGFSRIDSNENFRAGALAFFPQGKGFLYRVFFAVKPSALNSLTDKRLLVRGELYFHRLQGTEKLCFRQVGNWTLCETYAQLICCTIMVEPIATVDAVPLETFCAKRGMNVPAAFTVIVPVMWQFAAVTAVTAQMPVLSVAILV
jgi:hypothetical protein